MDFWQAIILSIVEGITEFLPISSTGHLVLTSKLLNITQTEFVKSFEISIQLGAVLAVVALYFKTLVKNLMIWKNILIAFIPTALIGIVFYRVIKGLLLGNLQVTVTALFLGGILLIILEKLYADKKGKRIDDINKISSKQAFLIGVCQSISIIPGVSRAASTILGGMFLGLKRQTATEFSFLLAIPTMLGATILDLVKNDYQFSTGEYFILGIGFINSFLVAIIVVKFLIQYVKTNSFIPFGIYRIIISILFYLIVLR